MDLSVNTTQYAKEGPIRLKDIGLLCAVFFNNLSQLPVFIRLGVTTKICAAAWAFSVIIFVVTARKITNPGKALKALIIPLCILIISLLFSAITENSYMLMTQNILIDSCVFFTAYLYSAADDGISLNRVYNAYIISAVILAAVVYVSYFYGTNSVSDLQYTYSEKNSIAHILLAALIMCGTGKRAESKIKAVCNIVCAAVLLIMIILLKSRAAYVGLALSLAVIVFSKDFNKHIKRLIILSIFILLILLFVNPHIYDVVINKLLFANRKLSDLDALSSGRLSIIRSFPERMQGNLFFGAGSVYFECFPLAAIINYGVFWGLFVIAFTLLPIKWYRLSKAKMSVEERILFICIAVSFISDALFECLAPIGPGAKCYIYWLLIGVFYGRKRSHENKQ